MSLIKTARLGLRNWKPSDLEPFIKMNMDAAVMAHFPKTFSKQETTAGYHRFREHFEEHGFCYFAVELLENQKFIGFIGLMHQDYESHFTPCVDMGWRLRKEHWGKGYATEGAKACLTYAFDKIGLEEVVAVAPKLNVNSERVMQKIGMVKQGEFKHPKIEVSSPLELCSLYKMST